MATLLVIAPFFVMPTVSALIWKNMMMHPVYGFLAVFMNKLGLQPSTGSARTRSYPSSSLCMWALFLILFTSIKSLDQEQKRRRWTGQIRCSSSYALTHLSRAIGVVVMIETIFLLSIFAEIYTTTSGGPGTATTNLAFLVYALGLQQFDAGSPRPGHPGGGAGQYCRLLYGEIGGQKPPDALIWPSRSLANGRGDSRVAQPDNLSDLRDDHHGL